MIAKNSKSYPYLAIAQHYNIPYAEVLKLSDLYEKVLMRPPFTKWKVAVWFLERDKHNEH